jgi:hypothetical protein
LSSTTHSTILVTLLATTWLGWIACATLAFVLPLWCGCRGS